MKFLLILRVFTIAVLFLFINKFNGDLIAPLSIFTSILHEMGHAVGAIISGGDVSGMTLAPDCPCLYACTRGGSPLIILIGGNLFSILGAFFFVYIGRILSKIPQYNFATFAFLSLLMFMTVRLVSDEEILSLWLVVIYILLFIFFMISQSSWGGAFLIFFGFLNLLLIVKDLLKGGILSDISRYTHLTAYIPPAVWVSVWFGTLAYICFVLLNQVLETKVDWIEGKRFFRNLDIDKILLFFSILPNLIGFAVDQLLEFLLIEFQAVFNGIRSFLSI